MRPKTNHQPKTQWRSLHGIVLFDKPHGLSSNAALQKVRHLFRAEKAGHTGSLDPLATGLLPICFGEATKIAGLLLGSRKAYDAECALGVTTDTDDADGEIVSTRPVPALEDAAIHAVLAGLTGRITQVAPVYSALKQAGVPLYRRARRGEDVIAPAREVDVSRFELTGRNENRLRLHVECGSGTYVRSLVRDLGERIGCGAHVTQLRRLGVEPFMAPRMFTLEAMSALDEAVRDALILPLEAGLGDYRCVAVDPVAAQRLRQGRVVECGATDSGRAVAIDDDGRAVALVECDAHGRLRSLRGFNVF